MILKLNLDINEGYVGFWLVRVLGVKLDIKNNFMSWD